MKKNVFIGGLIVVIVISSVCISNIIKEKENLQDYIMYQVRDNILMLLTVNDLNEIEIEYLKENSIKFLGSIRKRYRNQDEYSKFMSQFQTINFDEISQKKATIFIEKYKKTKPEIDSFNEFLEDIKNLN